MTQLLDILTGEQKKVLSLPVLGPVQIKGAAGSGKTTVALLRAAHLLESHRDLFVDTRIAVFTYTKSLVRYLDSRRTDHALPEKVMVSTVDQWSYRFLANLGAIDSRSIVRGKTADNHIREAIERVQKIYPNNDFIRRNTESEFFKDEISWIKGNSLESDSEYFEITRAGRGTAERVTKVDREFVWQIYTTYNEGLATRKKVDFDDLPNMVLKNIEKDKDFQPPFSHVVIDEAQDLPRSKLVLLSKIVDPSTSSSSLIADAAQRIYKSGFSWKDVGFNVQGGRSIELKKNHRNTKEIAKAAESLISHDPDFKSDEYTVSAVSEKSGKKPLLAKYSSSEQQLEALGLYLGKLDLKKESAVVLHRLNSGVQELKKELESHGLISTAVKQDKINYMESTGLFHSTMSSIKGLEFDTVFICDVNADIMPWTARDQELDDITVALDRRLLYVSMTRARDRLAIMCVGEPSRYISEIDPSLLTVHERTEK